MKESNVCVNVKKIIKEETRGKLNVGREGITCLNQNSNEKNN